MSGEYESDDVHILVFPKGEDEYEIVRMAKHISEVFTKMNTRISELKERIKELEKSDKT